MNWFFIIKIIIFIIVSILVVYFKIEWIMFIVLGIWLSLLSEDIKILQILNNEQQDKINYLEKSIVKLIKKD